jgi:hypothetical protein
MMSPAKRLALALDPVQLARACGVEPDPWQRDLLRSSDRQVLLNCSRQSGKSTVTALLAAHTALFHPGLVLLLSPTQRQSGELFRKVKGLLTALGEPSEEESALRLELPNGARVVSLPGSQSTVRGYSKPALVVVDEAAFVADELIAAVRPMLAVSRGRFVMLSTPFGQRGAFFEAWENGGADWRRFKVTAYDCPRIDKEWLESERRQLGDYFFRSEYLCEFLGTVDSVFRYEDIRQMVSDKVEPLFTVDQQGGEYAVTRNGHTSADPHAGDGLIAPLFPGA